MKFVASNDDNDFSGMYWINLFTVPESVYVIGLPKEDFSLILVTNVVNVLSKLFFWHIVLMAPQSDKTERHVSEVKFFS